MKHPGIFCVWAALHITAFDAVGFATFARDVFSTAVVIWRKGIFRIGSPNCFALVKFLLADGQPVGGLCFFAGASFLFIPGFAGPGTDLGRAVGEVRTGRVRRTGGNSRRSVPAIVSITGLALGRTIAPIGLTAVRTAVVAPVAAVVVVFSFAFAGTVGPVFGAAVRRRYGGTFTAHVGISAFAFGRAVVVIFHTAIPQGNVGIVAADVAVVGVGHLADRGTGRGIIFGAAVLPFVNPGRTDAVGILSAAAVPRYRTRIRTVGRVVKIHILADAAFVSAAAGSALSDFL